MTIEPPGRPIARTPLLAVALMLTGCWVAPVATVQPQGEARLLQEGITVKSVKDAAVVSSIDRGAGTIVLRIPGRAETSSYRIGPTVSGLTGIKAGDVVQATVTDDLAVYVLRNGRLPGAGGAVTEHARVLAVDASYRLLRLQYPDGQNETLKVPPATRLGQMAAGDSVVIRPVELLALRRKG